MSVIDIDSSPLLVATMLISALGLVGCGRSTRQAEPDLAAGGRGGGAGSGGGGSGDAGAGGGAQAPEELVSMPHAARCPSGLAVDERDLFWIRENEEGEMEVGSAAKEGGPARVLARLPAPKGGGPWHVVATDENAVYFGGADSEGVTGVFAVQKAGGESSVVAPFGALGLLVDSSGLYIAAPDADPKGIYAVTAENAEPVHVPGTEAGVNGKLASDETYLYWSSGSTLFRVPKVGGGATIVRENVESYPGLTAVDSGLVYWLGDGWLQRAPVAGGAATLLAEFRAASLEARDGTAYSIGLDRGIKGLLRVSEPDGVDFTRGAFADRALALDETFAYVARCEFVCLEPGMPATCHIDWEYDITLVRLPRQ